MVLNDKIRCLVNIIRDGLLQFILLYDEFFEEPHPLHFVPSCFYLGYFLCDNFFFKNGEEVDSFLCKLENRQMKNGSKRGRLKDDTGDTNHALEEKLITISRLTSYKLPRYRQVLIFFIFQR